MLFNSFEFAIFLPLTFIIYWFILGKNLSLQNLFLLAAGLFFYGWWDWRFISLLLISSSVDYVVGLRIHSCNKEAKRKLLLIISLVVNLGILGFFKYYNFFVDSISDFYSILGIKLNLKLLKVILPLGISFYTFQALNYTIDIYRRLHNPTSNIITFFAYVSFFPQLVAGPIERARNLLPQFTRPRRFDYQFAGEGLKLILWGLVKKVIIADNCARSVEYIFSHYNTVNGNTLLLGAVYFAFQIYGDFSGYSDIARGVARLFGFDLMKNFAFPYFSMNIREFWKRWHISLSTWFRDYVYIPLGGNRCSNSRNYVNIMTTFLLSGLWHGANWTFMFWGFLHGLYLIIYTFAKHFRFAPKWFESSTLLGVVRPFVLTGTTFFFTSMAWVFFRSENISVAFNYIGGIFTPSLFSRGLFANIGRGDLWNILFLIAVEWKQRNKQHPLSLDNMPIIGRWLIYLTLSLWLLDSFVGKQSFIYFQF